MSAFFTSLFGVLFFGGYTMVAIKNNSPEAIIGILGGCFLLSLLVKGYNIHPHKQERDRLRNEYIDDLRERISDDIALMCAVYDNIHSSYQSFVANDANLMFTKANKEHIHLDQSYIEMLYYEYLKDPNIGLYVQFACGEYDLLP